MHLPNLKGQLFPYLLIRQLMLAVLVLVSGIYLSHQAELHQQAVNQQKSQAELQRRLNRLASTVVDKITLYQYGLRGLRGSILSVGADNYRLSNMQFYAQSRDIASEFPGARGFGFIRKVEPAQLATFLTQAASDRGEPFLLKQLQTHHDDLFVIQYVEPYERNKEAVGLDIGSDASRRQAALQAAYLNAPMLTAPITLVQQAEKTGQGFLFLLPIYRGAVAADSAARYQQLVGWSYAPLLIDEILRPLADVDPDLQLQIKDLATVDGQVFFQLAAATGGTSSVVASKKIMLFGRSWLIEATASPHFISTLNLPEPAHWFHYGVFASVLMMVFTGLIQMLWLRRHHINQQRSLLTAIVSNANEAIIGLNHQGQVLSWNQAATELFGYSTEQALGRTLAALIVPIEQQNQEAWLLNQLMAGYSIHGLDTVRRHQQGHSIAVSINASPIDASRDDVTGFAVTIHDISQLKAAELTIRQHNQQLEAEVSARTAEIAQVSALQTSMLNSTHYAVIATDLTGIITAFNPAAELLLGYCADELIGIHTPEQFHDPAEVQQRAEQFSLELGRQISAGFAVFVAKVTAGRAETAQWYYVHKNGHRLRVSLTITALLDQAQQITGYLGVAHDLTQQLQLEFELALAKVSTEQTVDFVIWLQQDGTVLKANAAMAMALGFSEQQLSKLHISQLLANYDTERWHQSVQQLQHSASVRLQECYRCFNGDTVPVSLTISMVELAEQRYLYLVARDISTQLQKEAELAQAKEIADGANRAKSAFLSNISHDIRAPIEQVLEQLRYLEQCGLNPRQSQYLAATTGACGKLTSLLQDITDFSSVETGRVELDTQWVELPVLLKTVLQELQHELARTDLELMVNLASQVPTEVFADSQRLRQVLLYLMLHAIHACRGGQVILHIVALSQVQQQVQLQFTVQHHVVSVIQEPAIQGSVDLMQLPQLQPSASGGHGLSLSLCQRLVELMGGQIQYQIEPGCHKSVFQLWLTQAAQPKIAPAPILPSAHRLLLVEPCQDSANILQYLAAQLGYQTELAVNAEQALAVLQQDPEGFALLLLNWRLAGQDGCQFAARILSLHPNLQGSIILMATPYQRSQLANYWQAPQAPAIDGLLLKPYLLRDLELALQDVFQAPLTAKPSPQQSITGRLSGLRLLLVDKNPCYRQLGSALLQHEGCTVVTASTGQQAMTELADSLLAFDLVLLDLILPDVDGFSIAATIRQQARYRKLPLVAMSVQPLLSDKLASLAGGLDEHVAKPFDIHTLVQVIIRLTSRPDGHLQQSESLSGQWSAALQSFVKEQQVELETAVQRLGNSLTVYHKTLQIYCSEIQQQILWLQDTPTNGPTLSEFYWRCRNLRTTAAVLGLTELMQVLRNFENLTQVPDAAGFAALRKSLEHWLEILAQLQALTGEIRLQPTELQQQFLLTELESLSIELAASNMHAVARFAAIQRRLAQLDAASTSTLDKLINQLDFNAAVKIVEQNICALREDVRE
jgi:PAS domain S-box-containing protein